MTDEHKYPPEPVERQRVPAGQVLVVVAVALLVAAFLNADRLDYTARTQPYGWRRDNLMRVTGALKAVSHATGLDRPRRFLAERADNVDPPPPEDTGSVVTAPPLGDATTTTTRPPVYRTPSVAAPVRILVAGDSLMGWIGPALLQGLPGAPIDLKEDWQVGTGLARPDVRNWPSTLRTEVQETDPEVVVLGFGGNDVQDMLADGKRVTVGSKAWEAEYQRRVAQVLNAIEGPNRTVYWIGLPVTARDNIEKASPAMARVVRAEIAVRPWAHYVDTKKALSPDGTYIEDLPDGHGGLVKVRTGDGVHPTLAGAERMVRPLVAAIRKERKL
jgi:hypothetical protein